MADEDEIRELIGRLSAAQRQGFHLTPSAIRLVLVGLQLTLAARKWLLNPQADPREQPVRKKPEPYTGPLPTIGDSRKHGMTGFFVDCGGAHCHAQRRFTFDELGLPDDMIFIHIPRARRFRCGRCGSREVSVAADWPNPIEQRQREVIGNPVIGNLGEPHGNGK